MNRPASPPPRGFRQIFGAPITLALLSTVGLISALVGDGAYDTLSWLALGVPIAVIAWFLARRDTGR